MKKSVWTAALAAAALVAAPAMAQTDATEVEVRDMTQPSENLGEYNVAAQAGVNSFIGGGVGESTGAGPLWGVKLEGPLARSFGWELGYEGSRTPVNDAGTPEGAALWRHGLNGMAKVYAPVETQIRPFAGAGIGASFVNAGVGTDGLYENDLLGEIPVSAGLEYQSEGAGLTAGLRVTNRFLFDQDMRTTGDDGGGSLLGGSLVVGGQF